MAASFDRGKSPGAFLLLIIEPYTAIVIDCKLSLLLSEQGSKVGTSDTGLSFSDVEMAAKARRFTVCLLSPEEFLHRRRGSHRILLELLPVPSSSAATQLLDSCSPMVQIV